MRKVSLKREGVCCRDVKYFIQQKRCTFFDGNCIRAKCRIINTNNVYFIHVIYLVAISISHNEIALIT